MSQQERDYEAGYAACEADEDYDESKSEAWQNGYTDCALGG
jgi:hypothetical protein